MFWIDRYIPIDGKHIYGVWNLNDAHGNAVKISLPIWILGIQFPPGRHPTVIRLSHLWQLCLVYGYFLYLLLFCFLSPPFSPCLIPTFLLVLSCVYTLPPYYLKRKLSWGRWLLFCYGDTLLGCSWKEIWFSSEIPGYFNEMWLFLFSLEKEAVGEK